MKLVKNYMKRKVVHFSPKDSVFEAAKVFSKYNISGAPVVHRNKVVGVISEADIIKFLEIKLPRTENIAEEPHVLALLVANLVKEGIEFIREIKKISKTKVENFMTKEVLSIHPGAQILEAAQLMSQHNVNRLPVIENQRLVGNISRADLIRALLE